MPANALGTAELSRAYEAAEADPGFGLILDRFGPGTDVALAELIEADGRLRLRLDRSVELRRYLDAVPGIRDRPDALDTAIDMALRWIARTGAPDPEAVARLVADHPDLEAAIRDGAALGNAIWSTTQLRTQVAASTVVRPLPAEFGPRLEDGRARYELRRLLGEGAFGRVYQATDRRLSESDHAALVSIKVLTAAADQSKWARKEFLEEATKARRIDHPNVVRVLDRGTTDGGEDYIVSEFVDGGDLARWVRRRAMPNPPRQAARLVARIARGVHAAHMAGLVHCDIKPGNVMMTHDDEPKITDFGIAIRSSEERPRSGETEAKRDPTDTRPQGNLAFISPEQYRGEPGALTVPSDIFALGGILYWLLTNRLPNGSDPAEIKRTHDGPAARREPPSPAAARPGIDREIDLICRRALAVRPEDRFGSARSLAEDIESWLRREPIPWTRPSIERRLQLWARRKPGLAVSVVLIALLIVGGTAALFRLSSITAERRLEAAVAERRLEVEAELREDARQTMQKVRARLIEAGEQGLQEELLPQIWVFEWVVGPTVLGIPEQGADLWQRRIATVRTIVERLRASEGEDHLETLIWENALAFWLVADGDHREAEPLIAENRRKWERTLRAEDPWLLRIDVLAACVAVNRVVDGESRDDGEPAALAERLERATEALGATHRASPLLRLALHRLDRLYGPDLLDDADRRRAVGARIEALDAD